MEISAAIVPKFLCRVCGESVAWEVSIDGIGMSAEARASLSCSSSDDCNNILAISLVSYQLCESRQFCCRGKST